MRHWFKTPVSIWVGSNARQVVSSAEEAARLLLDDELWPVTDTLAAREVLLAALEGGADDPALLYKARKAFAAVAKEAGILAD
jgi:hypothetical protein